MKQAFTIAATFVFAVLAGCQKSNSEKYQEAMQGIEGSGNAASAVAAGGRSTTNEEKYRDAMNGMRAGSAPASASSK